MTVAEHLIVVTRFGDRRVLEFERASYLWVRLRVSIPDALSLVLMPDHLHLVALPGFHATLRRQLNAYTHRFGTKWDLRPMERATTPAIAKRVVRYGFLNPVRANLVDDPLDWPWSTLRDLVGAAHPRWTDPRTLAKHLRRPPSSLFRALTQGTPPPDDTGRLIFRVDAVREAVASALRIRTTDVTTTATGRRLAVQLAFDAGRPGTQWLAQRLGLGESTVRRLRHDPHPALAIARRCLRDDRLRHGPSSFLSANRSVSSK